MPSSLLEAGTSFLSNGLVPAVTAGLAAKDATESGYIWGTTGMSECATGTSEGAQVHLGLPWVHLGVPLEVPVSWLSSKRGLEKGSSKGEVVWTCSEVSKVLGNIEKAPSRLC